MFMKSLLHMFIGMGESLLIGVHKLLSSLFLEIIIFVYGVAQAPLCVYTLFINERPDPS